MLIRNQGCKQNHSTILVPRKLTFIRYRDFDSTTRKLPVIDFMERLRDDYDKGSFDLKWYTLDFTCIAPDGRAGEGREKSIEALRAIYSLLRRWCPRYT